LARGLTWRVSSMPRTYLIFGDIEGKLDVLNVQCTKCARKDRYHVRTRIEKYGRKGNLIKWKEQLNGDCPRRDSRLHDRCDLVCPYLQLATVGAPRLVQAQESERASGEAGSRGGLGTMTDLLLRRAQAGRASAQGDDDYDVIDAVGLVIGRIFKATTSPADASSSRMPPWPPRASRHSRGLS
jgi:hypothetical protein